MERHRVGWSARSGEGEYRLPRDWDGGWSVKVKRGTGRPPNRQAHPRVGTGDRWDVRICAYMRRAHIVGSHWPPTSGHFSSPVYIEGCPSGWYAEMSPNRERSGPVEMRMRRSQCSRSKTEWDSTAQAMLKYVRPIEAFFSLRDDAGCGASCGRR